MPWGDGRASDRFGFPHSNHRRCQMHASNICTPIVGHIGTIYVAVELSQKTWLVVIHSPDRDRISRHKLAGGDHAGLLALLESVRSRAARALGSVAGVVSCYEAGYDGFWLHRRLTAAGITNFVFDPASIAVEQRSRRAKTDRLDGELLLRTLMAHCRGEPRVVRIVRVPSREQEDARRDSRERQRLVKEQTGHTNRIKALLRLLGMAAGNPRRRDWLTWLARQRDWKVSRSLRDLWPSSSANTHGCWWCASSCKRCQKRLLPAMCLWRRPGWRSTRRTCAGSRVSVRRSRGH